MNIEKFIKNHPSIQQAAAIREICRPLELLNITYFSHAHIDSNNQMTAIATTPEYFELYFNKGYYHFDLHMEDSGRGEKYILWDLLELQKESQSLDQDFMSFNLGHTFSIMINNDNGKDCYHFATRLGNEAMNGTYLRIIDQLKHFINYFNEKIAQQKELNIAYSQAIGLEKTGGYLFQQKTMDFDLFLKQIHSKRVYSKNNTKYLTRREFDCLFWLSKGKTIAEAAIILKISARTVKAHINSAKEKLQCINQFQLGLNYSKLFISE